MKHGTEGPRGEDSSSQKHNYWISLFLLLAVMLQVQKQKQPYMGILQSFLCSVPSGLGVPVPHAWGMLKNKHIPFGKWESERFGIIDSIHKRCSSGWKGQVTMQFQYSGCFDCLFFLLFFAFAISIQTFIYESFGLKLLTFSHNGQENCPLEETCMYQDPCTLFFSVTKAESPPLPCPIKMHECKGEVCVVCLLQCTTVHAVSWEIEFGLSWSWYLFPACISPWAQYFISLSSCLYVYCAIVSGYPQANQTSLFAGGRYWKCIFTIFEKNNGIKARTLFITWSWIHVVRILSFNYLQGKVIGCCWHRGRTCGMWPSVVGRSALTPLSTRSTP